MVKVKLSHCLNATPWRCIGGVEVKLHTFLTSASNGGEELASHSAAVAIPNLRL